MLTVSTVLSGLALIIAYAGFHFGLIKWLVSRIDLGVTSFKEELIRHQQADIEALREVRVEIQAVRDLRGGRKRAK